MITLPLAFETDRLKLTPLRLAEAQAAFDAYASDPEVARYVTWRPHRSVAETTAYIDWCVKQRDSGRAGAYGVKRREDGLLMGIFELRLETPYRWSFGYALGRAYWSQGYMSEALSRIADWALDQSSVWRLWAACDVDNLASARVMEKAGFAREGILRRWTVHPNIAATPRDCFCYGRTRRD